MNLLSIGGFFTEAVAETWMSIWLSLNSLVYGLISTVYQLFVTVANVSLFSDDIFKQITGRLYVVMGIAMLFIFAYNLVLMIINPDDKKGTGQTTKIVKETIISLVLIILLPTIFKYMNIFQYHVLNSNIIGQIILGSNSTQLNCDYTDMKLLNEYIDDEKQQVNFGSYCVKGATGGAAVGGTVGAIGGTTIGTAVPVVGNIIGHAAGLGIGAAAGGAIGCVGGLIVGGIEKIAKVFGYNTNEVTTNLSAACKLYEALPDVERGARTIAPTIFAAFYHPVGYGYNECFNYLKDCGDDTNCNYTFNSDNVDPNTPKEDNGIIDTEDEKKLCAFYVYDINMAKYSGDMSIFNEDSDFYAEVKSDSGNFEFNYLLAFISGALALYMFVCYTLAIGKRVAKLGFLQIISPITVMMRIIPKQKEAIFDKWLKELINTYIDVFIRLVIIYFALFSISLVPDVISNLFNSVSGGFLIGGLAAVVVILGILQFAQEAPELFKQFFGASGNFSLKSPKKQLSENKLAMAGVNAFRGGVYGATTGKGFGGRLGGFFSGAGRGAVGGYDKAVKGIDTARTERENGSKWYNRAIDRARVGIGMETRGESDDRVVNQVKEKLKVNSEMQKSTKNIKDTVTASIEKDNSKIEMSVDGVTGNYQTLLKYSQTLLASAENEKDESKKKALFQQYTEFMKKVNDQKDKETEAAMDAIIKGHNYKGAFKDHEIAAVSEEIAKIKSETGQTITSFDEHKNLMEELGKENIALTEQLNKGYSDNYKARKADTRWVRGNGQSEKK